VCDDATAVTFLSDEGGATPHVLQSTAQYDPKFRDASYTIKIPKCKDCQRRTCEKCST